LRVYVLVSVCPEVWPDINGNRTNSGKIQRNIPTAFFINVLCSERKQRRATIARDTHCCTAPCDFAVANPSTAIVGCVNNKPAMGATVLILAAVVGGCSIAMDIDVAQLSGRRTFTSTITRVKIIYKYAKKLYYHFIILNILFIISIWYIFNFSI